MGKLNKMATEFKRAALREILMRCSSDNVEFFHRMYPGGVDKIKEDKLDWAYTQCINTIKKNKKKEAKDAAGTM